MFANFANFREFKKCSCSRILPAKFSCRESPDLTNSRNFHVVKFSCSTVYHVLTFIPCLLEEFGSSTISHLFRKCLLLIHHKNHETKLPLVEISLFWLRYCVTKLGFYCPIKQCDFFGPSNMFTPTVWLEINLP